jgi:hypothetical protein
MPAGRARHWCSHRCRQTAYRRRQHTTTTDLDSPPIGVHRRTLSVYECDGCGTRLVGEQRCPDCNTWARRVGTGGSCPSCGDPVTINELLEGANER